MCAQNKDEVSKMKEETGVKYTIFSDPEHKLRNYLAEQELVNVVVCGGENSKSAFYRENKYFKPYKFGVAQPAILFSTKEHQHLYAYATQPCNVNWHGALNRPEPKDAWAEVQKKLAELAKPAN